MSRIEIKDYIQNVELNREILVQHCKSNDIEINDNASLSEVVIKSTSINKPDTPGSSTKHKVVWADIDGTDLYIQEVDNGASVSAPDITPDYDPEYLEFTEWVTASDLTNVTEDIVCLASYSNKLDSENKQWTILKCKFIANDSPTLEIGTDSNARTILIDWGDGSAIETYTTAKLPSSQYWGVRPNHTYVDAGDYNIRIYSDTSYWNHSYNSGQILRDHQTRLYAAYLSNNFTRINTRCFNGATNLLVINRLVDVNSYGAVSGGQAFYNCASLKTLSFSCGTLSGNAMQNGLYNTHDIKYLIIKNTSSISQWSLSGNSLKIFNFGIITNIDTGLTGINNLENLNLSNIINISGSLKSNFKIKSIILPNTLESINSSLQYFYALETVDLSNCNLINYGANCFENCYLIKTFILPVDFNFSINLYSYNLTDSSLTDIATKLRDNSDLTTPKIITFYAYGMKDRLKSIKINDISDSTGNTKISLLEYIQSKNWTVSAN